MTPDSEPIAHTPVVPAYDGPCLSNVVPALLAQLDRTSWRGQGGALPSWMPGPVSRARQIVLLVLDGLGWEQLVERRSVAPTLSSATGGRITSVAPSTTAAALTSLVTGLPPAAHGVVGYRLLAHGGILNVLRWQLGGVDARRIVPPRQFQPFPAFGRRATGSGDGRDSGSDDLGWAGGAARIPVVSRAEYGPTGFTAAHLDHSVLHGWHTPSGLAVEVGKLLRRGEPFVYAYYDGIDRVAHAHGLGEHYDAELRSADGIVEGILEMLPSGATLVVVADHGQVDVGASVEVLGGDVMDGVVLLSGEGRFRWLHALPGAGEDVAAAAAATFGHLAWVRTREEVIDQGWLGGEPVPVVADRLGDVALVPFEPTAFLDPADTGEQRLAARHGSLTPSEMYVPLLAWEPPG